MKGEDIQDVDRRPATACDSRTVVPARFGVNTALDWDMGRRRGDASIGIWGYGRSSAASKTGQGVLVRLSVTADSLLVSSRATSIGDIVVAVSIPYLLEVVAPTGTGGHADGTG